MAPARDFCLFPHLSFALIIGRSHTRTSMSRKFLASWIHHSHIKGRNIRLKWHFTFIFLETIEVIFARDDLFLLIFECADDCGPKKNRETSRRQTFASVTFCNKLKSSSRITHIDTKRPKSNKRTSKTETKLFQKYFRYKILSFYRTYKSISRNHLNRQNMKSNSMLCCSLAQFTNGIGHGCV